MKTLIAVLFVGCGKSDETLELEAENIRLKEKLASLGLCVES